MNGKKGMELSINFIVMLILAIVIFGFGLKIGYSIIFKSNEMADTVSKDAEKQLTGLLTSGSKVAIPEGIKKLKPGQSYALGIGIYNILDEENAQFSVVISPENYYKDENSEGEPFADLDETSGNIKDSKDNVWVLRPRTQEINPNEKKVISVPIKVPSGAKRGTYVFNIAVCDVGIGCTIEDSATHYGDKHQLMISVI